jgi:aminomethyltransferase
MTPNDLSRIEPGGAIYTALLNEKGGVIDDLIIYDLGENRYFLCVNAANKDEDFNWLIKNVKPGVIIEGLSESTAMLALQGPKSAGIMAKLANIDIKILEYIHFVEAEVAGINCLVSRTGYTGEDGFELFCAAEPVAKLWEAIINSGKEEGIVPVGLGARDTLRLEMGYPLWGSELDEEHTPLESGIGWICRWDKGDFIAKDILIKQKDEGAEWSMVGLELLERAVPRHNYTVVDGEKEIGTVTSGTMSPTLGIGIALARIRKEATMLGKTLEIIIHGKPRKAKVVRLPFVEVTSMERSTP